MTPPAGSPTPDPSTADPRDQMSSQPQRPGPSGETVLRHTWRRLDPSSALRLGEQKLQTTDYLGNQLVVRPPLCQADEAAIYDALTAVAKQRGFRAVRDRTNRDLVTRAREVVANDEVIPIVERVELTPLDPDGLITQADAWEILQHYRARSGLTEAQRQAVQLNHVITSHPGEPAAHKDPLEKPTPYWHPTLISPTPYWHPTPATGNPYWHPVGTTGNPYWHPTGIEEYATPGFGGRTPVQFVGPPPTPTAGSGEVSRPPVIAVLDTGVAEHHWLTAEFVDRQPCFDGIRIGLTDPEPVPSDDPRDNADLLGGLAVTTGHGTFIAGLIRQTCPDARILAVRVIQGDGVVAEADLLDALGMLWLRQRTALADRQSDQLIDVVSLSLGYYHEQYGDRAFDPFLLAPLRALARLGVTIVTSAGNDATVRPMYPAAFAPWGKGPIREPSSSELPVIAVGALNPDGTIAMFSNEGPWVSAYRPGAALLSTLPLVDGSRSPTAALVSGTPHLFRSTIDPDDFRSGFGIWSGTSFAAPILAAELARQLLADDDFGTDADFEPRAAVARGWAAVAAASPYTARPESESTDSPGADPESSR
ncbi:MAG: S8/S53 family peptidase [Microlunatus sp.]|nr:S8/S53 family peptidase [Microlunatus sp.]